MVAAHENAPAQVLAADRGDRPRTWYTRNPRRTPADNFEKLVERLEADVIHVDVGIDDGLHAKFGPQDQAGEAQAADGGAKQLAVLFRRADAGARHSSAAVQSRSRGSQRCRRGGDFCREYRWRWRHQPRRTLVPGVTGRNQPRGTITSRISASDTPASQRSRAGLFIERDKVLQMARHPARRPQHSGSYRRSCGHRHTAAQALPAEIDRVDHCASRSIVPGYAVL